MKFRGHYSLMYVMPDISRPFFLKLGSEEQKLVRDEVTREIRDTIDIKQLKGWTWKEGRISADKNGFKPEEEIRRELEDLIEDLGINGNCVSLGEGARPVIMGLDKRPDCGVSNHFAYALQRSRGKGKPSEPWIIGSPTHPQILFEMQVALVWVAPPSKDRGLLTPQKPRQEPGMRRGGTRKKGARPTTEQSRRKKPARS